MSIPLEPILVTAGGDPVTASDNSIRGIALLPIVFDPGGTKMASIASNLISLSGGVAAAFWAPW